MNRAQKPALVALGALVLTAALGPVSAMAAPPEECGEAPSCTERFEVTGVPELWTVPEGVDELSLTVAAGAGGSYFSDGGAGGQVEATVSVEPGDQLAFIVGDRGQNSNLGGAGGYGGGAGSFGNGYGGGGGGGSFVFAEDAGSWSPMLVAGGGGGGAGDENAPGTYDGAGFGGAGGFVGDGADAAAASTGNHVAGATVSAAGYSAGTVAAFDGAALLGGQGQGGAINNGGGSGGGGGGYYGGAGSQQSFRGGGGGSGFAATGATVIGESANEAAAGFIEVRYANLHTAATVTASTEAPLAGDPVTLTGQISQFDVTGGSGTLAFLVTSGGEQTTIGTVPVTTAGSGPFTATAEVEFVPPASGEYFIDLVYTDDGGHYDTSAAAITLEAGQRATATTVAIDPESPVEGDEVVLTATVTDAEESAAQGVGPISGTVTFFDGETQIGSSDVVDGVAALTWEPGAGDYDLRASYAGDATYTASEAEAALTVTAPPTPTPSETPSPSQTPEPSETPTQTEDHELAETGGEAMVPALLTLGLLAAGAVLLMARRRRVS
ncbi:Ig-like domain-containing protein [Ruania halotolerans]|uniref:Ig-like domain-containing protein n=1 Tax=Ruania halotolerans TaxID=2897773 RepID=UPI001E50BA6C|nr:Ig-like domain-containing protein [Ruania halotolerans]UFU07966.1 Ig-like domain-containing protein [Ruania halotolerans]